MLGKEGNLVAVSMMVIFLVSIAAGSWSLLQAYPYCLVNSDSLQNFRTQKVFPARDSSFLDLMGTAPFGFTCAIHELPQSPAPLQGQCDIVEKMVKEHETWFWTLHCLRSSEDRNMQPYNIFGRNSRTLQETYGRGQVISCLTQPFETCPMSCDERPQAIRGQ